MPGDAAVAKRPRLACLSNPVWSSGRQASDTTSPLLPSACSHCSVRLSTEGLSLVSFCPQTPPPPDRQPTSCTMMHSCTHTNSDTQTHTRLKIVHVCLRMQKQKIPPCRQRRLSLPPSLHPPVCRILIHLCSSLILQEFCLCLNYLSSSHGMTHYPLVSPPAPPTSLFLSRASSI